MRGPRLSHVIALALDTATAATTVAVVDGSDVLAEAGHHDARGHAEALPRLVREVLHNAHLDATDVDLVACGVGPGPFTGLRVGVAFARAVGAGLAIPVVGACTLDVIALGQSETGPLTVVTRHRRGEVAWATYDDGRRTRSSTGAAVPTRRAGPLIVADDAFERRGLVVGDIDGVDAAALPSAGDLGILAIARLAAGEALPAPIAWPEDAATGSGEPAERMLANLADEGTWLLPALPLYLRRPDAVPA
jgi:tRNA threonylcarbamoyl adenosine modification protein YeaZ